MKTLAELDNDLEFKVITGLESVVQRVKQRLQFFKGEWYFDGTLGIPYLSDVLGHAINIDLAEQAITSQIRTVPEVIDVRNIDVSISPASRKLFYSATVISIHGEAQISIEPLASQRLLEQPPVSGDILGFWVADAGIIRWTAEVESSNNYWTAA